MIHLISFPIKEKEMCSLFLMDLVSVVVAIIVSFIFLSFHPSICSEERYARNCKKAF